MKPHPAPSIKFPSDRPLRVILLGMGGGRTSSPRPSGCGRRSSNMRDRGRRFSRRRGHVQVDADVAVVLGGDGSILQAVHQMGDRQLPVIAVNLGKLGFLADVYSG